MDGIQRRRQREKGHIKDLYCVHCRETVKTVEVRYNDLLSEMYRYAEKIRGDYYPDAPALVQEERREELSSSEAV